MDKSIVPQSNPRQLRSFTFGSQEFRAFMDNGDAWFFATDATKTLGYSNSSQAITDNVDSEDKGYVLFDPRSDIPPISDRYIPGSTIVINESGLYSLILRSNKPEAREFKRFVTHEVLPTIRKTGSFGTTATTSTQALLMAVQKLVDIETEQVKQADAIKRIEARQDTVEQKQQYFTIYGYANYISRHVDNTTAIQLGKRSTTLSKQRNIHIGKEKDTRRGYVNSYHEDILRDVFGNWYSQWPLE